MRDKTYTLDGKLYNYPHWWDGPITGTLEEITNTLIDNADELFKGDIDLSEYWAERYWNYPSGYSLSPDEEPPARPEYTEETVIDIAGIVYDECERHFTLTPNEE